MFFQLQRQNDKTATARLIHGMVLNIQEYKIENKRARWHLGQMAKQSPERERE